MIVEKNFGNMMFGERKRSLEVLSAREEQFKGRDLELSDNSNILRNTSTQLQQNEITTSMGNFEEHSAIMREWKVSDDGREICLAKQPYPSHTPPKPKHNKELSKKRTGKTNTKPLASQNSNGKNSSQDVYEVIQRNQGSRNTSGKRFQGGSLSSHLQSADNISENSLAKSSSKSKQMGCNNSTGNGKDGSPKIKNQFQTPSKFQVVGSPTGLSLKNTSKKKTAKKQVERITKPIKQQPKSMSNIDQKLSKPPIHIIEESEISSGSQIVISSKPKQNIFEKRHKSQNQMIGERSITTDKTLNIFDEEIEEEMLFQNNKGNDLIYFDEKTKFHLMSSLHSKKDKKSIDPETTKQFSSTLQFKSMREGGKSNKSQNLPLQIGAKRQDKLVKTHNINLNDDIPDLIKCDKVKSENNFEDKIKQDIIEISQQLSMSQQNFIKKRSSLTESNGSVFANSTAGQAQIVFSPSKSFKKKRKIDVRTFQNSQNSNQFKLKKNSSQGNPITSSQGTTNASIGKFSMQNSNKNKESLEEVLYGYPPSQSPAMSKFVGNDVDIKFPDGDDDVQIIKPKKKRFNPNEYSIGGVSFGAKPQIPPQDYLTPPGTISMSSPTSNFEEGSKEKKKKKKEIKRIQLVVQGAITPEYHRSKSAEQQIFDDNTNTIRMVKDEQKSHSKSCFIVDLTKILYEEEDIKIEQYNSEESIGQLLVEETCGKHYHIIGDDDEIDPLENLNFHIFSQEDYVENPPKKLQKLVESLHDIVEAEIEETISGLEMSRQTDDLNFQPEQASFYKLKNTNSQFLNSQSKEYRPSSSAMIDFSESSIIEDKRTCINILKVDGHQVNADEGVSFDMEKELNILKQAVQKGQSFESSFKLSNIHNTSNSFDGKEKSNEFAQLIQLSQILKKDEDDCESVQNTFKIQSQQIQKLLQSSSKNRSITPMSRNTMKMFITEDKYSPDRLLLSDDDSRKDNKTFSAYIEKNSNPNEYRTNKDESPTLQLQVYASNGIASKYRTKPESGSSQRGIRILSEQRQRKEDFDYKSFDMKQCLSPINADTINTSKNILVETDFFLKDEDKAQL